MSDNPAAAAATDIHCFKCKTKTASLELTAVVMSNGRDAVRAVCAVCGGKKFRIGKMPGVAAA